MLTVDVVPEGWKLLASASNIVQIIFLEIYRVLFEEIYRVLFDKSGGLFFDGLVFGDKFGQKDDRRYNGEQRYTDGQENGGQNVWQLGIARWLRARSCHATDGEIQRFNKRPFFHEDTDAYSKRCPQYNK